MLKEAPKSLHPSGAPGGQAPEYAASRELNGEGEPAVRRRVFPPFPSDPAA